MTHAKLKLVSIGVGALLGICTSMAIVIVHDKARAADLSAEGTSTAGMPQSRIDNVEKENQTGFGLQAGSTTGVGLTVEHWLTEADTIVGAVGEEHSNVTVAVGKNWIFRKVFSGNAASLAPYVGGGLIGVFGSNPDYFHRTAANPNFALAFQIPLGVEWLPRSQRFSVYGQLGPSAELTPVFVGVMTGDIGARFYF
jgi:hypothetical protein